MNERGILRRSGVVVTPNDAQLFRWLWMLRVITLNQLRRVGYYQPETGRLSALDNVRKRLSRLRKAGYLTGDRLMDTRERIYHLGEAALGPLREHYDLQQQRLYQPKGLETLRQVQLSLMVSECAVRITAAIRGSALSIPELPPLGASFYHTHAVGEAGKRRHVERFVTQDDLRVTELLQPLRIRPDLVFALSQRKISRLYFLEADRASESSQQIADKQLAYHHYQRVSMDQADPDRRPWHRYGPMRDFRVLFVTTDERRVKNLVKSLRDQPGFDLMVFSSLGAVREGNMAFDPIWTNHVGAERALAKHLPD